MIPHAEDGKLMELMCPRCSGELAQGIFMIQRGKEAGRIVMNALLCDPCSLVWEKP